MAWTALHYQKFGTKFEDRAMKERLSLTPGTPRFTARRLEKPEDKVNPVLKPKSDKVRQTDCRAEI